VYKRGEDSNFAHGTSSSDVRSVRDDERTVFNINNSKKKGTSSDQN